MDIETLKYPIGKPKIPKILAIIIIRGVSGLERS